MPRGELCRMSRSGLSGVNCCCFFCSLKWSYKVIQELGGWAERCWELQVSEGLRSHEEMACSTSGIMLFIKAVAWGHLLCFIMAMPSMLGDVADGGATLHSATNQHSLAGSLLDVQAAQRKQLNILREDMRSLVWFKLEMWMFAAKAWPSARKRDWCESYSGQIDQYTHQHITICIRMSSRNWSGE